MAKKKGNDDDYKNVLVYFGDSKADVELHQRLTKRCKFQSPSTFMKEAAEEKLDNEERYQAFIRSGGNIPTLSYQKQNTEDVSNDLSENAINGIIGSFEMD